MANVRRPPIITSRYAAGTGVFVTALRNFGDSTEEPENLIRFNLRDPDTSVRDVGVPLYQMTLVKSFVSALIPSDPKHISLLHCDKIKKIIAIGIFESGDYAATDSFLVTYADLTAVDHAVTGGGYVMASVPVPEPDVTPTPHYVTSILSVPTVGDKLGVTVLPLEISGHVVAAAPVITGSALGFSGSELTDWRWTGFVARRSTTDSDHIIVFAGLEKLDVTRKGTADLSGSANYVFTVRESDGGLESAAQVVVVDYPFTPHQMVEGRPNNATDPTFWCIGRIDPEFVNPFNTFKMPSVVALNSLTLMGSIGIWASSDPELLTMQRLWQSPIGISSPPIHHLDSAVISHQEVSRDLGILYANQAQRLIPFHVDNDSAQDPVTETPRRSAYDFV